MTERLRVLVVDDSRSEYVLARELLAEASPDGYTVGWAQTYEAGLEAVRAGAADVALVDYQLGAVTGVDLVRQALADGCWIPLILFTARGDQRIDIEALAAGAADYVDKAGATGPILDRAIRYAVRHQRTLELLRRREERFRALIESSADAIVLLDRDARVVYASESVHAVSGVAPADAVGRSVFDFIHPDDAPRIRTFLEDVLAHPGVPLRTTYRTRLRDGLIRHREGVCTNRIDEPSVGAIVLNFHDVTERAQAEQRTRFTLEMAQIGLWNIDLVAGHAEWSDTMAAVTGIAADRFPRSYEEFAALVHPDDRPKLSQAIERAGRDGGRFITEFRMTTTDGTVRWQETKGRVFTDEAGTPVRVLGVGIDVTERKQLEDQFRQSQKMEAIGHLAGGVAHDFNNILTAILGYCEIVVDSVKDRPEVLADIQEIKQAGERAARLTRQLLAFGRRQHVVPRVFDLNQLVRDTENMLARVIGEDVEIAFVQDRSAGAIKADSGQIEQVLMNLAVNARDAMPTGGKLTIATRDVHLDAEFVGRNPGSAPGRHTCLEVRDTGCGMSPDVISHIFEPFYTTKQRGKGTGLGLSTVYGIVKQSGGYIAVESTLGEGTTFRVYFRVASEPVEPVVSPKAAASRDRADETILLVEDEPAVRAVIAKTLMQEGYTVLVASDPDHAMAIAESHETPIHLLLSDVIMPHMNGPELAQRIVSRRPEMGVLYVSGFADRMGIDLGTRSGRAAFLHKPFTAAALTKKVREQLDGRS